MVNKHAVSSIILLCFLKYLKAIDCGQPHIRPKADTPFKIAGGTVTIPYSFPWQVYLKVVLPKGRHAGCAGTLINHNWVLTCAHCFFVVGTQEIILKFGVFDRTKCPRGSIHYHISKHRFKSSIFIHPLFVNSSETLYNDIALVKIPQSIKYTYHISPICLPRNDTTVNVIGKQLTKIVLKFGVFDRTKCPRGSIHYHISKHRFKSSIFIHPGFVNSSETLHNDIALVKVPQSVKYSDHISPICLPRNDTTVNVIGKQLIITGWGFKNATSLRPHKLQQAVVQIQPADLPNVFGCYHLKHFDKNIQICAGLPAHGGHSRKGTCVGDSGGPLVEQNKSNKKWYQYGVISGGHRPCGANNTEADDYTRVAYYCDWLEQIIGESVCQ